MSSIFHSLPEQLVKRAFEWRGEFAWSRDDAIEVMRWMDHHQRLVIGVEVWIPSPSGPVIPAPYVYVWSLERSRRLPRSETTALDYVQDFCWDANDLKFKDQQPYFNLTLDRD